MLKLQGRSEFAMKILGIEITIDLLVIKPPNMSGGIRVLPQFDFCTPKWLPCHIED